MGRDAIQVFLEVGELRSIGAKSLSSILKMDKQFFEKHGIDLDRDEDDFQYDKLVDALLQDREDIDPLLLNSLFLVADFTTASDKETLTEIAIREGVIGQDNPEECTPLDLAVKLLVKNPALLENERDKRVAHRKRSFVFLRASKHNAGAQLAITPKQRARFESVCNEKFKERFKGGGTKVKMFKDKDVLRLLVRHGESMRREGAIKGEQSTSILYRPEMFDVFYYDLSTGILGMPACPKWQSEMYRTALSHLLYGSKATFEQSSVFTFAPLEQIAECNGASLSHGCDNSISSIKLVQLEWRRASNNGTLRYRGVNDVFSAMKDDETSFPRSDKILSARFNICFKNNVDKRYFEIQGANKVSFQRDSDIQILWSWLERQGFLAQKSEVAADPGGTQNLENPNSTGELEATEEANRHVIT